MLKYKKVLNNKNAIEIDGKIVLSFDPQYKEYLDWRKKNPKLEKKLIRELEIEKENKFLYANGKPHITKINKNSYRYVWYFSNGIKKFQTEVVDDVFHGKSISWNEHGQKIHEGKFKDGKRFGKWIFYDKGGLVESGTYKDDKFYTIEKETIKDDEDILVRVVETHSTPIDVRERKTTYWNKNIIKSDVGLMSGTSLSFHNVRSKHGKCVYYWKNGNKMCTGEYFKNEIHGKWIWYYENGNVQNEINYKMGSREGIFKFYYKNGNIKIKGKYKNNRKNGTWIINNKKRKFKNGKEL